MYEFSSKQELLDSFTIYSMQCGGMDKVSASEYAKMMCSYDPSIGWRIRDYGVSRKVEPCEMSEDAKRMFSACLDENPWRKHG